jgi:hypothetical protein
LLAVGPFGGFGSGCAPDELQALPLIHGLPGRAAAISRTALIAFPIFFIAWASAPGIGTGLTVDQANGLGAADHGPMADAIQGYFDSPVLFALSLVANGTWIVAMIAAALAFRRAEAPTAVAWLIGFSSLFVAHDAGPVGAIGLLCLATVAILLQREQAPALATP